MAPFGKNFLKARLKNRAKDKDDREAVPGKEIQVSVCNDDKVVCGVTKHTTCADIVQALLDDQKATPESKRLLHGDPRDFCLLERWKGFERALPPLTRILRLWNAWGDQRSFVQFVLVKASDFVPQAGGKKGAKLKGAKGSKRWEHSPVQCSQSLPIERQKRLVKKAFRKLEKIHKENREVGSSPGSEEIDRMVQLLIQQDHTIRQQIQRMRELDSEMERFEAERPAGQHDAEFPDEGLCPLSPVPFHQSHSQTVGSLHGLSEQELLQESQYTCDRVAQVERQAQRHRDLIAQLSRDIDAELTRAVLALPKVPEEDAQPEGATAGSGITSDVDLHWEAAEMERLRAELRLSLHTGLSLHAQTTEVEKELKRYDATLFSKDRECWELASQLSQLQVGDGVPEWPGLGNLMDQSRSSVTQPQAVRLKHSLSPTDATDTDSDTGISSTHSQDSLSPCLDTVLPPLDTDV
ncbi:ras association domain-containing protein 9 [Esox lucius]|uniref:Ras-associating domain-containing protein n=1 Tax=Esox lucius TaxID=8010 RepID=A0A3P8ZXM2_ESOLU|nr:ras association domain-containing protein 9 [Esox lucius]